MRGGSCINNNYMKKLLCNGKKLYFSIFLGILFFNLPSVIFAVEGAPRKKVTLEMFLNWLYKESMDLAPKAAKKLVFLIIIFLLYRPIVNLLNKIVRKFLSLRQVDELVIHFMESTVTTIVFIFYSLIVISVLGIRTTSFLALLGSIGVGIGLALKGSLSDLAGGVQILVARYFTKGDYIQTCGVEGTVQKITFLYTVLYTRDNKSTIIPNGKVTSEIITNFSANNERRVDFTFSVAYDTSIQEVKNILREVAEEHELVLKHREIFVRLQKHNASSLDFAMRVWTKKENYWDVFFDMQELVKDKFDQAGIEIPYNKLDVYQK